MIAEVNEYREEGWPYEEESLIDLRYHLLANQYGFPISPISLTKSVTQDDALLAEVDEMFEILARGRQDSGVTIKLLNNDGTITECDVSLNAYREFIRLMFGKYQVASPAERSRILNAIVLARGCHRKTDIRLMTAKTPPGLRRGSGSRLGGYSEECKRVLKDLWHRMGRMSGRKMKVALPDWLPHCPFPIERSVRNELLRVSATTIDRWMKPERARLNRAAQSQTRPPKKR